MAVDAGVEAGHLLVGPRGAGVALAHTVLGGALVAEPVVVVLHGGGEAVVGVGAPLAVSGVELGARLVRSSKARMGLADGVSRGKLVAVDVVAVLKSGGNADAVSITKSGAVVGISAPLAVSSVDAGVEAGHLLEGAGGAGVALADGVLGGALVAELVVVVFHSSGKSDVGHSNRGDDQAMAISMAIGGIGAPLANTVPMSPPDSRAGSVAIAHGGPGGEARPAGTIEGFGGGHGQIRGDLV